MPAAPAETKSITAQEFTLVQKTASQLYAGFCPAGKHGSISMEDLVHCGIVGLLDASKRFDAALNVPWLAYASIRIRGEMMDKIRKAPLIRIPQKRYQEAGLLKKKKEELQSKGKKPDRQLLMKEFGWNEKKMDKVEKINVQTISVDTQYSEHPVQLPELNINHNEENQMQGEEPERVLMKKELAALMQQCLETLTHSGERLILVSRVLQGVTLKQLALTMECSIETIRLKQKQAQESMKTCLKKKGWHLEQ